MAASMNCMGGQALKLFLQSYGTSLRCNRLQMVKFMCDNSILPKLSSIKPEKHNQNKYTDDFLGIIDEQDELERLETVELKSKEPFDNNQSQTVSNSKISARSFVESVDDSVSIRRSEARRRIPKHIDNIKKTNFGLVRFDENGKSTIAKNFTNFGHIEKHVLNKRVKQKADTMSSWNSVEADNISESDIFGRHNKRSSGRHEYTESEEQSQDLVDNVIRKDSASRQTKSADSSVDLNFIDGQYFENAHSDGIKHFKNRNVVDSSDYPQTSSNMGYIDDQYFASPGSADMGTVFSQSQITVPENDLEESEESENVFNVSYSKSRAQDGTRTQKIIESKVPISKKESMNRSDFSGRNRPGQFREKVEPDTAYEMAQKIRREIKSKGSHVNQENMETLNESGHETERRYSGPVDSKGFRILKNQVPNLENTPSAMIVNELKKNIIYEGVDVIAIYKPYGLPSHGGPGVRVSVGQLLPQLYEMMSGEHNADILHLIHRLDKETTGVMLLAKTPEMAWRLKTAFRKQEVIKTYWVIVKGIPNPLEGMIDIPMTEGLVEGVHRMILKPEYTEDTKLVGKKRTSSKSFRAVTRYRVLDSYGDAALVECRPQTGIKHQIRVHLAYGLNTPILGDHKYSHFTKLAPQRLYPDMLQRLGIRQSKVRHVPMHLHAKSIVIPEVLDGRNLSVSCRLPRHFVTNMSRLKLKPPKH